MCLANILSYASKICWGVCLTLAQGILRAWLLPLDANAVVKHASRDLIILAGASPCLAAPCGHFEIVCLANILSYASNICWGVCLMLAQGILRAWLRDPDAKVVVGHASRDLIFLAGASLGLAAPAGHYEICALQIF